MWNDKSCFHSKFFFILLPKSYFLFGWKETMDAFEFTWKQENILSLKKLMATLGCLEFVVTRHPGDDINKVPENNKIS